MSFGKGRVRPISSSKPVMPPPEAEPGNRRWSLRRNVRVPGLVWLEGSSRTINCTITDMSATGARIVLQPGFVSPFRGDSSIGGQLTLYMRLDRMQVGCEIVRLDDLEIGVRFVSPPQPMAAQPAARRSQRH